VAKGLSAELSTRANEFYIGAPFLWLDNTRILTQQKNGKIILVRASDKQAEPELIADIPISEPTLILPHINQAADGTIEYSVYLDKSGEKIFKIDIENKKYEPL